MKDYSGSCLSHVSNDAERGEVILECGDKYVVRWCDDGAPYSCVVLEHFLGTNSTDEPNHDIHVPIDAAMEFMAIIARRSIEAYGSKGEG